MSLTFQDSEGSKLIGHVYGGKFDGKRIYISFQEDPKTLPISDPFLILNDAWFRSKKKNLKTTELLRLQHAITKERPPEDDELEVIYESAMELLDSRRGKE